MMTQNPYRIDRTDSFQPGQPSFDIQVDDKANDLLHAIEMARLKGVSSDTHEEELIEHLAGPFLNIAGKLPEEWLWFRYHIPYNVLVDIRRSVAVDAIGDVILDRMTHYLREIVNAILDDYRQWNNRVFNKN